MPAYEDELQCSRRIVAESLRWLDEAHEAKRHAEDMAKSIAWNATSHSLAADTEELIGGLVTVRL